MKLFKKILILVIGLFLTSCEDVINVDLETAQPKLVIDASINWYKNTTGNNQTIKLSTSTGYYSKEFPTVSGASVSVSNQSNTVFNFVETPNTGEYKCTNFLPVIGEKYTLTVSLNGQNYVADEVLTPTPVIENNILQKNNGGRTGDEIEIKFFYQDAAGVSNYYMNSVKTSYIAFPKYNATADNFFQGNQIVEFYSSKDLKAGDIVNINLFGISKRYYDYFNKILLVAGGENGPFQTAPVSVTGNIINQANIKNYPLGYFRLSEVDKRDYTIQ
jgi:hypothetical protein